MKFSSIAAIALVVVFASCKSADKQADNIAADYCDCLKPMEAKLSADAKRIISNAAKSDNPTKSIGDDVAALGVEKGAAIGEELGVVGDLEDPKSESGQCIDKLDKKYKDTYTLNEEKTIKKIITELDGKAGCDFTSSLMKLGLKTKNME